MELEVNVRKNRRGNREWTIKRNTRKRQKIKSTQHRRLKRRATWTHQNPGVGNYEKTSNTDPPKTEGGQL